MAGALKAKLANGTWVTVGGPGPAGKDAVPVQGGVAIVTTNGSGDGNITFPTPFLVPPVLIVINGDPNSGAYLFAVWDQLVTTTTGPFRAFESKTGAPVPNGPFRVAWIATART